MLELGGMDRASLLTAALERSRLLLLLVAVPPAATLGWRGLQLLAQDRALLAPRDFERRQTVRPQRERLQAMASPIDRAFQQDPVPDGMVRLSSRNLECERSPRPGRVDAGRRDPSSRQRVFADAERFEFQARSEDALPVYEASARSPQLACGPARCCGPRGCIANSAVDGPLAAYRRMATITNVTIAGAPGDLQARRAVCAVLRDAGAHRRAGG